jgi:glycine hydroxymethyltransferase
MAEEFGERGYRIISGGTDNHLILIDLRLKGITGKVAEQVLGAADITVNKNMIPYDPQPPSVTSGIRIGTAAITTRGLREDDCRQVVEWIDSVLSRPEDGAHHAAVRQAVNTFMQQFPLYT